jgi:hypothetical protein
MQGMITATAEQVTAYAMMSLLFARASEDVLLNT